MDPATRPRHHAILIGIDEYKDKPLTFCVRDIEKVRKYLSTLPFPVNVQHFTAPPSGEPSSLEPTPDIIENALREVTERGRSGDFVYIHFSGHGTPIGPPGGHQGFGDVGLVLQGEDDPNLRPRFAGEFLPSLIEPMVSKGLHVTAVLDCCFSGGTSRLDDVDPDEIPCLKFLDMRPDFTPTAARDTEEHDGELDPEWFYLARRDASMLPAWIVNPSGYTILTACGPHEVAGSLQCSKDKQTYSVLSYMLSETLERLDALGTTRTLGQVYDHLRAELRRRRSRQNPVLYGSGVKWFFDKPAAAVAEAATAGPATVAATLQRGDAKPRFLVQAGLAHGIHVGDEFALEGFYNGRAGLKARAAAVRPLTTELEVLNDGDGNGDVDPESLPSGWTATVSRRLCFRDHPVRISPRMPNLDRWREAARASTTLDIHITDDASGPFELHVVSSDDRGSLHILDSSSVPIPALPVSNDQNVEHDLDIIEHLIRFKHLEQLSSHALSTTGNDFHNFVCPRLHTQRGTFAPGQNTIEVSDADKQVYLEVTNLGLSTLHVKVFDLGPCWQVDRISQVEEVIPPTLATIRVQKQAQKLPFPRPPKRLLKMSVPDEMRERGGRMCIDVLKVFVTSRSTSLSFWEQPRIRQVGYRQRQRVEEQYQVLCADTGGTREGGEGGEGWAVFNFKVKTRLS